jgi:hypothetical protein
MVTLKHKALCEGKQFAKLLGMGLELRDGMK